jgi:hypothetical protein
MAHDFRPADIATKFYTSIKILCTHPLLINRSTKAFRIVHEIDIMHSLTCIASGSTVVVKPKNFAISAKSAIVFCSSELMK